jgi:hypothetical protein
MTRPSNKHQTAAVGARNHRYGRLFQAIILRAVQDLAQNEHQHEAREWLLSSESDYAFAMAGISPDSVRQEMA